MLRLLPLLLLLSCVQGADTDFDGDGVPDGEDCVPDDPAIYPEADDLICEGVDQDCDGVDGLDIDEDGFIDPSALGPWSEGLDCAGVDCNDRDLDSYPGAPEVPDDGIDQDCDTVDAQGDDDDTTDPPDDDDTAPDDDDTSSDDDDAAPEDLDAPSAPGGTWGCGSLVAGPPVAQEDGSFEFTLQDPLTLGPVGNATVDLFLDPASVNGTPDDSVQASIDGGSVPSGQIRSCTPFAARVRDGGGSLHDTLNVGLVTEGPGPWSAALGAASDTEWVGAPSLSGAVQPAGTALLLGTLRSCSGLPASGVEAGIGTLDLATGGVVEAEVEVRYMAGAMVSSTQRWTDSTGSFLIFGVPANSPQDLLLWGRATGGTCLTSSKGSTVLSPRDGAFCLVAHRRFTAGPDEFVRAWLTPEALPASCQ